MYDILLIETNLRFLSRCISKIYYFNIALSIEIKWRKMLGSKTVIQFCNIIFYWYYW